MKYSFLKNRFDMIFKIILLLFVAYFLYLLTLIVMLQKTNSDIGRYQFRNEGRLIIDTKTGKVTAFEVSR